MMKINESPATVVTKQFRDNLNENVPFQFISNHDNYWLLYWMVYVWERSERGGVTEGGKKWMRYYSATGTVQRGTPRRY